MDAGSILLDALDAALGPQAAVYALAAIGLNVHLGYAGLLNLGQAGFMLLGGYGLAVTVVLLSGPLWLGVLVGLGLAAAFAVGVGTPTLRLPAAYLAVVTLVGAEVLRRVIGSRAALALTGGVHGLDGFAEAFYDLNPIPPGDYGLWFLAVGSHRRVWVLLVGWALVVFALLLVRALMRSPRGRTLTALRQDDVAAQSLGKNTFAYKLVGLVLGGVIGAAAGILLAIDQQAVHPVTYLPTATLLAYTALILGGVGRLMGPALGAVVLWFTLTAVDTALNHLGTAGTIDLTQIPPWHVQSAVASLALLVLLLYRPHGLLGTPGHIDETTDPSPPSANVR